MDKLYYFANTKRDLHYVITVLHKTLKIINKTFSIP